MATVLTNSKHYSDIAKALRAELHNETLYQPNEMAGAISLACDAARQDQEKAFWSAFQEDGSRTDYYYAFYGRHWNFDMLKLQHNISPEGAARGMFYLFGPANPTEEQIKSLKAHFESLGITLNTAKATSLQQLFAGAVCVSEVPTIDLTGCSKSTNASTRSNSTGEIFRGATALKTIEKLKVYEANEFVDAFKFTSKLENIVIDGIIGQNIDFTYCKKLTKASIESVLNALSLEASGKTVAFALDAINNAYGSVDSEEWQTILTNHSNWAFTVKNQS